MLQNTTNYKTLNLLSKINETKNVCVMYVYLPLTSVHSYKITTQEAFWYNFSSNRFFFQGGNKTLTLALKEKFFGFFLKGCIVFTCNSLKTTLKNLIENWFFTVGNIALTQDIGIPMDIDPLGNHFWYFDENQFMKKLISNKKIKSWHFHSTKWFINDLFTTNDSSEFGCINAKIYPKELKLKQEHQGTHATFFNFDINIRDAKFV